MGAELGQFAFDVGVDGAAEVDVLAVCRGDVGQDFVGDAASGRAHLFSLVLRANVILAEVRAQLEHDRIRDDPLDPKTAVAVLELVREKIREPFPDSDTERPCTRPTTFDVAFLVNAGLAMTVDAPDAPDAPDGAEKVDEVEIHPDVLFAPGLVDEPGRPG